MKNIKMNCRNFFDVGSSEKYSLNNFKFENIDVKDERNAFRKDIIENTIVMNVKINGVTIK